MLFDRWRQRVLPWWHMGTTCRIRLNLCILRPTRVHNPNGTSICSAVFAQLTAESTYNLYWTPLSTRISPSNGRSKPHVKHDALGPCEPTTQTAPRSVQPCLHRWPRSVPILHNGLPVSRSKLPRPMLASGPHVIRGPLGPPESWTEMATWSFQPFLWGSLAWLCDRLTEWQTDRQTTLLGAMWHNNA